MNCELQTKVIFKPDGKEVDRVWVRRGFFEDGHLLRKEALTKDGKWLPYGSGEVYPIEGYLEFTCGVLEDPSEQPDKLEEKKVEVSIVCPKCQDSGFTEENHGLLMVLCDCEAGKKKSEELGLSTPDGGIILPPENMELAGNEPIIPSSQMAKDEEESGESLVEVAAEANAFANSLMPKLEGENSRTGQQINFALCAHENQPDECQECKRKREAEYELEKRIALGGRSDSNSGIRQPDSNIGSASTSQPQQHRERKSKKTSRKRVK